MFPLPTTLLRTTGAETRPPSAVTSRSISFFPAIPVPAFPVPPLPPLPTQMQPPAPVISVATSSTLPALLEGRDPPSSRKCDPRHSPLMGRSGPQQKGDGPTKRRKWKLDTLPTIRKVAFPLPHATALVHDVKSLWVGSSMGSLPDRRRSLVSFLRKERWMISDMIWSPHVGWPDSLGRTQAGVSFLAPDGHFQSIDKKITNGGLADIWIGALFRRDSFLFCGNDDGLSVWDIRSPLPIQKAGSRSTCSPRIFPTTGFLALHVSNKRSGRQPLWVSAVLKHPSMTCFAAEEPPVGRPLIDPKGFPPIASTLLPS